TDAVPPVVLVGETAARPPQHGDVQVLERGDDVVAHAARVRDRGLLPDPDAVVNQAPEMLGEVAVDVAVDRRLRLVGAGRQPARPPTPPRRPTRPPRPRPAGFSPCRPHLPPDWRRAPRRLPRAAAAERRSSPDGATPPARREMT